MKLEPARVWVGPHPGLAVLVNGSSRSLGVGFVVGFWADALPRPELGGLCAGACKCPCVVSFYLWVRVVVFRFSERACVCVGLCLCERVCVSRPGVHSPGRGLTLPVGEVGSCKVRLARAGWNCRLWDWPGWLLLGNSQARRCLGDWTRGMSHSSLPTSLGETSSLSPGPGFTVSHKEALPFSIFRLVC